jgi:TRAP-type C4-dicarboxylate transport system permease large subunit
MVGVTACVGEIPGGAVAVPARLALLTAPLLESSSSVVEDAVNILLGTVGLLAPPSVLDLTSNSWDSIVRPFINTIFNNL